MCKSLFRLVVAYGLLFFPAFALAAELDRHGDGLPPHAVARIGATRLRHGGAITSIGFSTDGKMFATTSLDRTASVWETETGRELVRCRGFAREPLTAVFSADGKTLACAAADGTLRVFALTRPKDKGALTEAKELHDISSSKTTATFAFSKDASLLAAGDEEGKLQLWDMKQQNALIRFTFEGGIRCLALSPDAKTLATTSSINGIHLWHAPTGKMTARLGHGAYSVLQFKTDGSELAAGNFDNEIQIFALDQGVPLLSFPAHGNVTPVSKNGVACLAYSTRGDLLASGGGDGKICVWNRQTLPRVKIPAHVFSNHTDRVTALTFSPDDRWLVSGGADNTIRIVDTKRWQERALAAPEAPVASLALSPDGKIVATIDSPLHRLAFWDARTGQLAEPFDLPPRFASAGAFAPNGKSLALSGGGRVFDFWELSTRKQQTKISYRETGPANPAIDAAAGLIFDVAGQHLATTSLDGLFISVWDTASGKRVALFTATGGRRAYMVSLSPDGALLASAGPEAMIRLWDVDKDQEKGALNGHSGRTLAVAFSPNGRLIASGGKDRMIRLWEVASGQQRQQLGGQPGWVRAVAFAPDGMVLASANTDGTVRLWDLATGRLLHELAGHRGSVVRLAFSAKGEVLASASVDTTVLVWDTALLLKNRQPAQITLTPGELDKAWEQLASTDVGVVNAALQTLARARKQTLPLLQKHVKPVSRQRLAKLLLDLDDDEFEVREAAAKELATQATFAEPALKATLKGDSSAEVRRSAEALLERLRDQQGALPEELRIWRCLEVLELIGTGDAKKVLANVATGAKEAELTRQAHAALKRLEKRVP